MDMKFLRNIERKQEGREIEMKFLRKSWDTEFGNRFGWELKFKRMGHMGCPEASQFSYALEYVKMGRKNW